MMPEAQPARQELCIHNLPLTPEHMFKRLTFAALTIATFLLLVGGIGLIWHNFNWLNLHRLAGVAILMLIMLAAFAVMMPLHLRTMWEHMTPASMVRDYAVRGGAMMAVSAAIFLGMVALGTLLTLPARLGNPSLGLLWLALLVPLLLMGIDLIKGSYARTMSNAATVYLLYAVRIFGMLALVFAVVGVIFLLFPAGIVAQLLSLGSIIGGFVTGSGAPPLLCQWVNVGQPACTSALAAFHIGHLLLIVVAIKVGPPLFDRTVDLYRSGLDGLAARLES